MCLLVGDFRDTFNEFLKGFEDFEIKTLADLIKWNEEHSATALPQGMTAKILVEIILNVL